MEKSINKNSKLNITNIITDIYCIIKVSDNELYRKIGKYSRVEKFNNDVNIWEKVSDSEHIFILNECNKWLLSGNRLTYIR